MHKLETWPQLLKSVLLLIISFVPLLGGGGSGAAVTAPTPTPTPVMICHFPPGSPTNVQVIAVDPSDVAAHVRLHNDAVCAAGDDNCCFGGSQSSVCTDFTADINNCGACGNECPTGDSCTDGKCVALPVCAGKPDGTTCPGTDAAGVLVCASGKCVSCALGTTPSPRFVDNGDG